MLRFVIRFTLLPLYTAAPRRRFPSIFFSTSFVGDNPLLVRDFIRAALYDPIHGYFSKISGPVGVLEKSIRFNQLPGRDAYLQYLDKVYKHHDIGWFTPVELFKPWYAYAIAEAILRTANLSVPLKVLFEELDQIKCDTKKLKSGIVALLNEHLLDLVNVHIYEIGGGSGTCAKCIMDYMMLNAPERVYNSMTYVSVEISPSLAKRQLETVGEVSTHSDRYKVEQRDALDKSGWRHADPHPCWVILLEVLDNLPHDLIYSRDQFSPWMEVWVEKVQERPLQDALISRCIHIVGLDRDEKAKGRSFVSAARRIWSKAFPKPCQAWLPTGCLQLLEVLHWALPKMSLIASDFSYLPDVTIMGDRAPLVSTKKDGITVDHRSYLDAKGDSDIFFPTDFTLLERIDHHCSVFSREKKNTTLKSAKLRRSIILDTAAFMEEFGLPLKTKTKDGYNPLLDDFRNTKFYLSVPTHNMN